MPAFFSTSVCLVVLLFDDVREYAMIENTLGWLYASILGFLIVFRTKLAYQRYFGGIAHVQEMCSKWNDAFTQMMIFIETSMIAQQKAGQLEKIARLRTTRARMLHWFS